MNVLIVDDHPLFRKGLCAYFSEAAPQVEISQASNGDEAIILLKSLPIEVAFLDIDLPGYSGFELLSIIRQDFRSVKVVMLTMHDEQAYAQRAFDLGASGYVLKDDAEDQLGECLERVVLGETFSSLATSGAGASTHLELLSDTERRIFTLVSAGRSSYEIASLMEISVRTVDNHRANMSIKLGLRGSNALLKFALQHK